MGYKYFNFDSTKGRKDVKLLINLIPEGLDGTIVIMADRPWTSQDGKVLGSIELKASMPQQTTEMSVTLPDVGELTGKHAIFFLFTSPTKEKSLCKLQDFVFE